MLGQISPGNITGRVFFFLAQSFLKSFGVIGSVPIGFEVFQLTGKTNNFCLFLFFSFNPWSGFKPQQPQHCCREKILLSVVA